MNAAGLWARQVGWMAGVDVAAGVVEHQYIVTDKSDEIPADLPTLRDPDGGFYTKPEPGALAIGGWEKWTPSVNPIEGFPWEKSQYLFEGATDRLEEVFVPATHRLPILDRLGIRTFVNGPIPISPDGEPIMGLAPGLDNFFVACGFTSGIAASGGAGQAMAGWILDGDPGLDLWAFDVRRFGPLDANPRYLPRQSNRGIQPLLRNALPRRGTGDRPRSAPQPALPDTRRQGRSVRDEVWVGAGQPFRSRRRTGTSGLATDPANPKRSAVSISLLARASSWWT